MTIAQLQYEYAGPKIYLPEGPYGAAGTFPAPGFKPGVVTEGDAEGEFTFLYLDMAAGQTVNQGDAVCWDNGYRAQITGTQATAGAYPVGMSVGTIFLGGRVGDAAAAPSAGNVWSFTAAAVGTYGIWAQRAGTSLLKTGTITTQATQPVTDSVDANMKGGIGFVAAGTHSNQVPLGTIASCAQSDGFNANTVTGSATLSNVSSFLFLARGQTLSGTGIPTGAVITDIGNGTVTMNVPATATGTAVAITAANGSTYVTTTSGSAVLTNVTSIAGFYPNQIVTGTGLAAGSVIQKIQGNSAPYTITLSAAATASAANINVTVVAPTVAAPNYLEAFLRWPYFSTATT
jgi:hypothetical protein